jgi:ribosomal protein L37AE/L43A
MNKELMKSAGFGKEVKLVEQHKCPFCKKKVNEKDFRDELSRKEYKISGLCMKCQDKMFGGADNEQNY